MVNRASQSTLYRKGGNMCDRSALSGQTRMYNEYYERDFHYAIQQWKWFMKIIGIPYSMYNSPSRSEKLISIAVVFINFFIMSIVIIPAIISVLFGGVPLKDQFNVIGPLAFCTAAAIKYCYIDVKGTTFIKYIQHIADDWKNVLDHDHRDIMLKNAKVGRKLIKYSAIFFYAGGAFGHTVLPISYRKKINETLTIKPLMYPGYEPLLDTQASPANEILYVLQATCAIIACSISVATFSSVAVYLIHACGQVEVLMALLNDSIDGKEHKNTTIENRLRVIARHHVRVLTFTAKVEEILNRVCLLELMTSVLFLCLIQYYFIMELENNDLLAASTYIPLWISFAFNIMIFCYIAELLLEQYNKIGTVVYSINWYNLTGNKAMNLIMIMMISQYPSKITAGKFVDLNLSTFGNVLKMAAVYFNLLRTVIK